LAILAKVKKAVATERFTADHRRADWLGRWDKFVQKECFKKLVCFRHIKQNNIFYLGRVCTPCLSASTGIYGFTDLGKLNLLMVVQARSD